MILTVLKLLIYAVFISLTICSEELQELIKIEVAISNDKGRIDHYLSSMGYRLFFLRELVIAICLRLWYLKLR